MKVTELIEKLNSFPPDKEVAITDGYKGLCYGGDFEIRLFEDVDGSTLVDIGIGNYEVYADG